MAAIIPEKGVKGDQNYLLQQHSSPKHVTIAGVGHWTSGACDTQSAMLRARIVKQICSSFIVVDV